MLFVRSYPTPRAERARRDRGGGANGWKTASLNVNLDKSLTNDDDDILRLYSMEFLLLLNKCRRHTSSIPLLTVDCSGIFPVVKVKFVQNVQKSIIILQI